MAPRTRAPRPGRRPGVALVSALAAAGCGAGDVLRLELGEEPGEVAYLVVPSEPGGTPRRAAAALVVRDGQRVSGERPELALEAGERALLVSLRAADLEPEAAGVPAGLGGLRALPGPPPGAPTVRQDPATGALVVERALPVSARVEDLAPGDGALRRGPLEPGVEAALRAGLRLERVVDPQACPASPPVTLRPFGASLRTVARAIGSPIANGVLIGIHPVDADRVVLVYEAGLYLVRRGEDLPAAAEARAQGALLTPTDVGGGPDPFAGLLRLDPGGPGAPVRFQVAASNRDRGHASDAFLHTIEVGPAGLRAVGTEVVRGAGLVRAVARAVDGELGLLADAGRVTFRGLDGAVRVGEVGPLALARSARALSPTGDPRRPWIAAFRQGLFARLADGDAWQHEVLGGQVAPLLGVVGGPPGAGGLRRTWVGDELGALHVSEGEGWRPQRIRRVEGGETCLEPTARAGEARLLGTISALATDGQTLFAGTSVCSAILALDVDSGCVVRLERPPPPGETSALATAIDVGQGEVLVGGRAGELWAAPWPP